jgi:asparagine synthase (glutamine-hydrolysing)
MIGRDAWDGLPHQICRMNAVQSHRGPDGSDVWFDNRAEPRIGLGHVRLAILDLSDAGRQPMMSPCGKQVITYNGEVYNYREIQRELEALGARFATRCDTEVVLKALQTWGVDAFRRFNGMWAIAWLNLETQTLVLSRDRFGVKPLYMWHDDARGRLSFASEIKALLTSSETKFRINTTVVSRYLNQFLLNAQEETFFTGITALPAGHYAVVDVSRGASLRPSIHAFWRVGELPPFQGSTEAFIDHLRELFHDAVSLRLRSDVPVGVLASGGLDSSSIAAAVHRSLGGNGHGNLNLIAAVSQDGEFSEEPYIDALSAHLGTPVQKVSLDLQPNTLFELLDTVIWQNDQPVSGFSTVAHYLLMKRARELGITVLLSGQGGDEVLGGYRKYVGFYLQDLARQFRWHSAVRMLAAFSLRRSILPQVSIREARRYVLGTRFKSRVHRTDGAAFINLGLGRGDLTARQVLDLTRLTVPSLVHYEDRMSMAFGREIRLPFLDFRVVDALMTRPPDLKLRDGWTKWIFRKAMEPELPSAIAWRRDKQGFLNPQRRWLKQDLAPRLRDLFKGRLLSAELGLIDQAGLQGLYDRYTRESVESGTIHDREIFGPLALETWLRRYEPYLAHA